jgi:membrane-associated phospholipid phosphatase
MQAAQNASVVSKPAHFLLRKPKDCRRDKQSPAVGLGGVCLWLLLATTILLGCAVAAFSVDCSVAQWFHESRRLGHLHYLRDLANISEVFGRAECVLLVAVLMWQLDRSRRWAVPGVAATALLSGLAADGVKMLIARARPHSFDFLGSVWSSFGPWLPLGSLGSASQSFPSAHTATAVGLAISLICIYPAVRGLLCVLPLLVAYQRLDSGAHFLSDALCGAAVGFLVATLALRARWFDRQYAEWFWGRVGAIVARLRPGRAEVKVPSSAQSPGDIAA